MLGDLEWGRFPSGTKDALSLVSSGVFKSVMEFYVYVVKLMYKDEAFDWRLADFPDACAQVACDLFLQGKVKETRCMLLYAAVVDESLARGLVHIIDSLNKCDSAKGMFVEFRMLCSTAWIVHNVESMKEYFANQYPDKQQQLMDTKIDELSKDDRIPFDTRVPTISQSDMLDFGEPQKIIALKIAQGIIRVYPDTLLHWVYLICSYYERTDKEDARWRKTMFSCPKKLIKHYSSNGPYVLLNDETVYNLATSGKKTLLQLGIKDGDFCVACMHSPPHCGPTYLESPPKIDNEASKKAKRSKKTKKEKKHPTVRPSVNVFQDPTEAELKQAHSKTMTTVFEEMRPILFEIRQRIISLLLHRTPPKKKKFHNKALLEKENMPNTMSFVEHSPAKAGKTAYPVLVSGEVSNLFKTSKKPLRKLSPRSDKITLDLHGMHKLQALGLLDESLPTWIDQAMKGDHPFVLPVDIICGGGSQLLSEAVANWIRVKPQVANRPKGHFS